MLSLQKGTRYYLYGEPCDMRCGIYSLAGLVSSKLGRNPLSGDVFIFIGKRGNQVRLLLVFREILDTFTSMILGRPTRYGTGIELQGDYYDLENLYMMIWKLAETVDEESPENTMMLNISYDIRKASQNQRELVKLGHDEVDKTVYKSVKLFWPDFLVALNLFRERAGYIATDRNLQANLYRLEDVALNVLNQTDPQTAQELAEWITGYHLYDDPLLVLKVTDINLRHLSEPNGKKRFRSLPEKMKILHTYSPESEIFERKMKIRAKELNCEPEKLTITDEAFDRLKWKW